MRRTPPSEWRDHLKIKCDYEEDRLTMRELTGHKVNPANDRLTVEAVDGPGPGGASHLYLISGFDGDANPGAAELPKNASIPWNRLTILFQNGPINEVGVNGVTHEALLAVLIDRLLAFQNGPFACQENADALAGLLSAQHWLQTRTKRRMERNVEGTHTV